MLRGRLNFKIVIDLFFDDMFTKSPGYPPVREDQLERVVEELELRCWDKVQTIIKSEESLGIEYDENVICDVCRSVSILQ